MDLRARDFACKVLGPTAPCSFVLDNDGMIWLWSARSDVTMGLWKTNRWIWSCLGLQILAQV